MFPIERTYEAPTGASFPIYRKKYLVKDGALKKVCHRK